MKINHLFMFCHILISEFARYLVKLGGDIIGRNFFFKKSTFYERRQQEIS